MHRILARRRQVSRGVAAHFTNRTRHAQHSNHSITAQNIVLLSVSRHGDLQLNPQNPLFSLSYRTFSTGIPPDVKPTNASSTPPVPPIPPVSKPKAKVELRPGPVKPTTVDPSSSISSQAAQSKLVSSQSTTVQQPNVDTRPKQKKPATSTQPEEKEASITEPVKAESLADVAKRDIEEAAQHGILAPPPPDAGWARRLFHQAKELIKFYIAGMKLIVANGRRVKVIQERVKAGGVPISRAESRFIQTYRSDIVKLVPFVFMILIIEEIIPLVVLYVPEILPSTCILPSQRERIDSQRHERQRIAYKTKQDILKAVNLAEARNSGCGLSLTHVDKEAVRAMCGMLGLSDWGILGMQRRRLSKYLTRVHEDDMHLIAERKGAKLSQSGLSEALWERGFIADSVSPQEQRRVLAKWLDRSTSLSSSSATDKSKCTPVAIRARLLVEMGSSGSLPQ